MISTIFLDICLKKIQSKRITGYVQQVGRAKSASSGWNPGKRQELIDRRRFEDN